MAKRKVSDWKVRRMSKDEERRFLDLLSFVRTLGRGGPQKAKEIDHINYIQVGECLYIQIIYEDGSELNIEICDEEPSEYVPA